MVKTISIINDKDLDKASNNELSVGYKVLLQGKVYNVYGYSRDKDYLVICSVHPEKDFEIGKDFEHTIPPNLSRKRIDKEQYYKKVRLEQVEDIYLLMCDISYAGIPCSMEIRTNGNVAIAIDELRISSKEIPDKSI